MNNEPSSGLQLAHLIHPVKLQNAVRDWLLEDTPSFDYGGFVVGEKDEVASLWCKSEGVLAGVPFFDAVFHELQCRVEWFFTEGVPMKPITMAAKVFGKVRNLLLGERVALNCLARTSGIATYCRRLQQMALDSGWKGEIAGTRKTTPGFRMMEKYAMLVGGISTHRYDLSSMVMLKDNHIWSAGSITQVVKDARKCCGFSLKVEVECRTLSEALEAAAAGAEIVMFDNLSVKELHDAAGEVKKRYPHVLIEASGGVTEETISQYFGDNTDVISLSRTSQGYDIVDFSLKIDRTTKVSDD